MNEEKKYKTLLVTKETHTKLAYLRLGDGETFNSIIKRLIKKFEEE